MKASCLAVASRTAYAITIAMAIIGWTGRLFVSLRWTNGD